VDGLAGVSAVYPIAPKSLNNAYGHPTPGTLATLAEHDVPVLRTDPGGDVTIDVTSGGWRVQTRDG